MHNQFIFIYFLFLQMGDHEELMRNDGLYAKLTKIQADILT